MYDYAGCFVNAVWLWMLALMMNSRILIKFGSHPSLKMNALRSYLFFGILFFAMGCDNEPEETTPFLTVDVGAVDTDPDSELWIFATDANGQLIDIRELKKGTNYLRTVQQGLALVDLTIVEVFQGSHSFTTYNDVPTDKTIKIKTWNPIFPPWNQVDLVLTNYKGAGDPYFELAINGGFGYPGFDTHSFSNGELQAPVAVYVDPGKLLISGYRNGDAVYSLTTGIKTRILLELDFDKFEPLTGLVTIEEASLGQVIGHSNEVVNGGNFFIQSASRDFTIENPSIQVGYVPGFDYYSTTIYKVQPLTGHWTSYTKVGAPVAELSWPEVALNVVDKTQGNFHVDCSMPVDQVKTSSMLVVNSRAVHWIVYGAGDSGGIRPNVPPMFLDRLNISSKEDFKIVNVEMVSSGGTYTHQDLLEEKLYAGAPKTEYEYFKFLF